MSRAALPYYRSETSTATSLLLLSGEPETGSQTCSLWALVVFSPCKASSKSSATLSPKDGTDLLESDIASLQRN